MPNFMWKPLDDEMRKGVICANTIIRKIHPREVYSVVHATNEYIRYWDETSKTYKSIQNSKAHLWEAQVKI